MGEEKYDEHVKAFFLDVAAKGKDVWNAWRRDPANKDVPVTFADVNFSKPPRDQINFSGFEFGDAADFSGCKWRGIINTTVAIDPQAFAPGHANFIDATFGRQANFFRAAFGDRANFIKSSFARNPIFIEATFGRHANFTSTTFDRHANFTSATFDWGASFADAVFGNDISFANAALGNDANFSGVAFSGEASFEYAAFGQHTGFSQSHFMGRVKFNGRSIFDQEPVRYAFLEISFANARFDDEADFSIRNFQQYADFTNARFYRPPIFEAATNVHRIDFTGAHIGFALPDKRQWTSDSKVPIRLRQLRKLVEETKNHDLERDLYIEERKAERGVYWHQLVEELKKSPEELRKKLDDINKQKKDAWSEWRLQVRASVVHRLVIALKFARLFTHLLWIAVMAAYWALADYGRSIARPFVCWLVVSLIIFPWLYGQILPVPQKAGSLDAYKYEQAVQMVARANAVPFVGPLTIDSDIKKFLFCPDNKDCHPIPPEGYQWLVIGQNVLSITLVFFIGLALRNYFRIK
jgi:hypothetical protein